jgi:GntR family transcriptional regulator, transcriptional repressor for pyruvate dehydrogenase complex
MTSATSPFRSIQPNRSFDDVVSQIEEAIDAGTFPAGERLPSERELMKLFGASRSTVREGLRLLEGRDLVQIRRGAKGGVFVTEPDARGVAAALESLVRFRSAGVRELAEFRPEFEAENARLAASRAVREDRAKVVELARGYRALNDQGAPWRELVELDLELHQLIASLSHNEIRAAISLGINRIVRSASLALEGTGIDRKDGVTELINVATAIERADADGAYEAMMAHVGSNSALEVRAVENQHHNAVHSEHK